MNPVVKYLKEIKVKGSDFEFPSSSRSYLKKLSTISVKKKVSLIKIIHISGFYKFGKLITI